MSSKPKELLIREKTKEVLKFLEHEKIEEACQVISEYKDILRYNFGLINFVPLIPRIRFSKIIPKNNDALKSVIETGFQIYSKEDDVDELLFFAAAKCDPTCLKECISKIVERNPAGINQVREGDTALMFLLKYGNISHENFPECMKILIEAGIDVNRNDYFSHNPLGFLTNLYNRYVNKSHKDNLITNNLKTCIEMLLATKAIDLNSVKIDQTRQSAQEFLEELHFEVDYSGIKNVEEDETNKLFKFLIDGDEKSFVKSRAALKLLNADDGNNTLLQLCCEKNLIEATKFLIKNGADLTKITERNKKTPLELAARRNHPQIFEALLNSNKIVIDEELFKIFLWSRPKHIKSKYFDEILKYKYLEIDIKSNNGNTPLHYAIIFSSPDGIHALLKRGASLTVKNDNGKTPLDYITAEDLGNYFDKCILPDSYNEFSSGKYEIAFNYSNLIEVEGTQVQSELSIVEKICDTSKLCRLAGHPLVSSFINVKWQLVEPLYKKLFMFHLFFYFISILSFINLNLLNYLGILLALVYALKIYYLPFDWKNNKSHFFVDVSIVTILMFSSVLISNNNTRYHLGIVTTIFMALSLHLFCRFSPKFAQFHAVLIKILSQIFSYLVYVFILSLFVGAISYITFLLNHEDKVPSDNYLNSFFENIQMLLPQFYLLCAFGVFVSVIIVITIMNSLANLQEHAEKIGDNYHLFGHKNIILFLKTIENVYIASSGLIKNPFIFDSSYLEEKEDIVEKSAGTKKKQKKAKTKNKFLINFYLNTNTFSFEKLLSIKLDETSVFKVKKLLNR